MVFQQDKDEGYLASSNRLCYPSSSVSCSCHRAATIPAIENAWENTN